MKKYFLIFFALFLFFPFNVFSYTEASTYISDMSIYELQNAIDNGIISYETIYRIYIERMEEYNKLYNAIININYDSIEQAKNCDEFLKSNNRNSLLYCMPVIVKDNIDVLGLPTTDGTLSLFDNYPKNDATIISNLKKAGAIVIAKANMSEFAFSAYTSTSSYGTVYNAYNVNYESYGSSGGSSVSVALSFAPIAIGTDTNLSVRVPASANNLYGLRPTLNTLSNDGIIAYDVTRDVPGVITKNALDNALVYAAMAEYDIDDYASTIINSSLSNITIGVLDQFVDGDSSLGLSDTQDDIKQLFNKSIELLSSLGVKIVHIDDFYNEEYANIGDSTVAGWTMCYAFDKYISNTVGSIRSFSELSKSNGHIYSLNEYLLDCDININKIDLYSEKKSSFFDAYNDLFEKYDLDAIIYPTTNNLTSKVGDSSLKSNADSIAPVLGVPAITIPMGDINGLYYGMDLLGLSNDELTLYTIANFYNLSFNSYILPDNACELYTIPDEVILLRDFYLENKDDLIFSDLDFNLSNKYYEITDKISDFLINYNQYDDKTVASLLYSSYVNTINEINNYKNNVFIKILFIIFVLIFLIFLIKKYVKKNNKKK